MSCYGQRLKYSVYDNRTSLPVATCATCEECAKAMGVSIGTFHAYLSPSGKVRGNRWTIVKEGRCAKLLDELETKTKTIGQYMKMCRLKKEMTRARLSRLTGIATSSIYQYESDKVFPTIINVITIADALDVSIDELIGRSRK